MWQNLYYKLFLRNGFLLDCNYSLANNLLHYELKYLGWIGLWQWWFGVVWIILVSFMRMDWCGYGLILCPFAGLHAGRLIRILAYIISNPGHRKIASHK